MCRFVSSFLSKMDEAVEEDYKLIDKNVPATKKLDMINEVVQVLSSKKFDDLQRMFLDEGMTFDFFLSSILLFI